MKRVVVVGGGPAGGAAALGLGRHPGIETIVVERKPVPRMKPCGSGLSPWTLKLLDRMGVGDQVRQRAFRIDGAIIAGREGDGVELRGDHETAVLLRSEFDELLLRHAETNGRVEVRDGVSVQRVAEDGPGSVCVVTSDGDIEADAVIDCSGATGRLSRNGRRARTLHTIMGWYEGVDGVSDVVELFFDRSVKPHYGWVFPETKRRVNIGICFLARSGPTARQRFDAFVEARLAHRLKNAEQMGKLVGHPVHASDVPVALVRPWGLVAGEAGRLVDSATAEGIYHALRSGLTAGDFLGGLLARQAPTREALGRYERRVQYELSARMLGGRLLMEALRGPVLDFVLRFRDSPTTKSALAKAFAGLYHG